jgi:hypothetical protein
MMPIHKCRFVKNERVALQWFVLRVMLVEGRVRANERVFVKTACVEIRGDIFFINGPLRYSLIIKSSHRYDVRPIPNLCKLSRIFTRAYPCCNPDPVVSPWIQISDDASVSLTLVDLSKLFNTTYFHAYTILQDVLNLRGTERKCKAIFADVFPL